MKPLLSIRRLTKRFGGLIAVRELSWDVARGEVVALLGDNGAGKSTLIKCITGVYHADEGEINFEGNPAQFTWPIDARHRGIETIYQDLALADNLDVGANVFLGREPVRRIFGFSVIDRRRMRAEAAETLAGLGIHIHRLDLPLQSLSGISQLRSTLSQPIPRRETAATGSPRCSARAWTS